MINKIMYCTLDSGLRNLGLFLGDGGIEKSHPCKLG